MTFTFDDDLAVKLGVNEAILLNNFVFWLKKNKANNANFFDGTWWTFNSTKAFAELFPFWSQDQIKRILNSLIKQGVLITGNYNASPYDRTNWYALSKEYIHLIDCAKSPNERGEITQSTLGEIAQPIPDNKTQIINTDNKHKKINKKSLVFDFDGFSNDKKQAIEEWLDYRKEIGKSYKSQKTLDALRNELINSRDIVRDIHWSISRGYQGIYPPPVNLSKTTDALHRCNSQDFSEAF